MSTSRSPLTSIPSHPIVVETVTMPCARASRILMRVPPPSRRTESPPSRRRKWPTSGTKPWSLTRVLSRDVRDRRWRIHSDDVDDHAGCAARTRGQTSRRKKRMPSRFEYWSRRPAKIIAGSPVRWTGVKKSTSTPLSTTENAASGAISPQGSTDPARTSRHCARPAGTSPLIAPEHQRFGHEEQLLQDVRLAGNATLDHERFGAVVGQHGRQRAGVQQYSRGQSCRGGSRRGVPSLQLVDVPPNLFRPE